MSENQSLVLNHRQIGQKITRMAYEIYERNSSEEEIFFAGISGMGKIFADLLASKLQEISPLQAVVMEVLLDKNAIVQGEVKLSMEVILENRCLILVDDVLNTGKTLAYALKPFLEIPIKKMELAVLVNRSHKLFPVSADYTGLELSTTLNEHIAVDLTKESYTVHLH
ncbi:pyrimidine operon attenuation protein / uracil phosphoribosyltransferase [Belliella buryatensis]|uniref:Pyrimidine operon attenuation protein / uracil phosphoribosyltransferase n=1 Tax=Belliella buryatensis TaxID=1500549 RepID=A0A239AZU1_9BACT|nr:phosphoribosyltransferase family protein [Belliella buryatensis]SNS01060.1 pyrimidine operon attenuation protein / uracil phosphoribosyltransferase [Belliella buryatensis]